MSTIIGSLGQVDTLQVGSAIGNRIFTDLTNLIILFGDINANSNATFRKLSGSSGYQVPGGKSFVIKNIRYATNGSLDTGFLIAQADNDVGFGSATGPTNPVYPAGSSNRTGVHSNSSVMDWRDMPFDFTIATGKYIHVNCSVNSLYYIYGYEV